MRRRTFPSARLARPAASRRHAWWFQLSTAPPSYAAYASLHVVDTPVLLHEAKELLVSLTVSTADPSYLCVAGVSGVRELCVHEENLYAHKVGNSSNLRDSARLSRSRPSTPTSSAPSTPVSRAKGSPKSRRASPLQRSGADAETLALHPEHGVPVAVGVNDLRAASASPVRCVPGSTNPLLGLALDAHPHLPLYAVGSAGGGVALVPWTAELTQQCFVVPELPGSRARGRVTAVRFDPDGTRLAVTDERGFVRVWRFANTHHMMAHGEAAVHSASEVVAEQAAKDRGSRGGLLSRLRSSRNSSRRTAASGAAAASLRATTLPLASFQAASKHAWDVCFLGSGSMIATVGGEADGSSGCVSVWDVIGNGGRGTRVAHWSNAEDLEGGASAVTYIARQGILVVGTRLGNIVGLHPMSGTVAFRLVGAHSANVKSLSVDPSNTLLASGSSDGSVRVYDLETLSCVSNFAGSHEKKTFVRGLASSSAAVLRGTVSSYGVTQVVLTDRALYSCGADGRILRRDFVWDAV